MRASEDKRNDPALRAEAAQALQDQKVAVAKAWLQTQNLREQLNECRLPWWIETSYQVERSAGLAARIEENLFDLLSFLSDQTISPDSTYVGNVAAFSKDK